MEIDAGHVRSLKARQARGRHLRDIGMRAALVVAAGCALAPLLSIIGYIVAHGLPALHSCLFTSLPKPIGEAGGGLANAFAGSIVLVLLAAVVGIPWGVAIGVYLSEFGRGKMGSLTRFCADLLVSVPSIILGLFAYALIVIPLGHFSAMAGGAALAIMMIPTVARGTEELLRMVPRQMREAGLALGLPRWRVTLSIVVRSSMRGIITASVLAVARIAGETAPLLFTAFNNRFWSLSLTQPISSVPVQIYTYAISPYEEWHQQAWAAALVLVMFVLCLSAVTRLLVRVPGRS